MNDLSIKVLGLFLISCFGFIYGLNNKEQSKDIAKVLMNVISPVVVIISIIQSPGAFYHFYFSIGSFFFCSLLCLTGYLLSSFIWTGNERNLFAFTAGTGNTGYFALPIILGMSNESQASIAIFIIVGVNIYEFSIGYFILSKGRTTLKNSLKNILKIPVLHAATLGVIIKSINLNIDSNIMEVMNNFKGAYSVLGMLLVGIILSRTKKSMPDFKFMFFSIAWKHVLVPIVAMIFIIMPKDQFNVIFLMALSPLAGNTVVFSSSLDLHPEKAASSVLISSLLSILLIPLCMQLI